MTIYTVLAPPVVAGSADPEPDGFVFVKEGFCWPALYMTAIWLVWRRMWLVLVLYVAASAAILAIVAEAPAIAWPIVMLFGFLVALEANNLRRWTLERRGYRFVGVASGDRPDEAEFRFFAAWPGPGKRLPAAEAAKPLARPAPDLDEVVGLFPKPGGTS